MQWILEDSGTEIAPNLGGKKNKKDMLALCIRTSSSFLVCFFSYTLHNIPGRNITLELAYDEHRYNQLSDTTSQISHFVGNTLYLSIMLLMELKLQGYRFVYNEPKLLMQLWTCKWAPRNLNVSFFSILIQKCTLPYIWAVQCRKTNYSVLTCYFPVKNSMSHW